jgi:hypothetical protein
MRGLFGLVESAIGSRESAMGRVTEILLSALYIILRALVKGYNLGYDPLTSNEIAYFFVNVSQ